MVKRNRAVVKGQPVNRFLHDFHNRVLHFLRHPFQLRRVEQRQQCGRLQRSQNSFTTLLVNRDPACSAVETLMFSSRTFFACCG